MRSRLASMPANRAALLLHPSLRQISRNKYQCSNSCFESIYSSLLFGLYICHATINTPYLPCNEITVRVQQQLHHPGNVLWLAHPTHGVQIFGRLLVRLILPDRFCHSCLNLRLQEPKIRGMGATKLGYNIASEPHKDSGVCRRTDSITFINLVW